MDDLNPGPTSTGTGILYLTELKMPLKIAFYDVVDVYVRKFSLSRLSFIIIYYLCPKQSKK